MVQIVSQTGAQNSYYFDGAWIKPRKEWFHPGRNVATGGVNLKPFTLMQLGAAFLWLVGGYSVGVLSLLFEKAK